MFQSKFHNLLVAVGIVLLFTGFSSSLARLQQVTTAVQDEQLLPVNARILVENYQSRTSAYPPNLINQSVDTEASNAKSHNNGDVPEHYFRNEQNSLETPATTIEDEFAKQISFITPVVPERINIPSIELDAPVVRADIHWVQVGGVEYKQWNVPNLYAAGWHESSALLGEVGNTVFNGHNNVYGEVFRHLDELVVGDFIQVYSSSYIFEYVITNTMILPERFQEIDVRMSNAQWILPSDDHRLTLISCWPYESNTHRVIIVAKLLSVEAQTKLDEIENLPIQ
jgi:LPXTG-site transpeptidase (sortase) family protein